MMDFRRYLGIFATLIGISRGSWGLRRKYPLRANNGTVICNAAYRVLNFFFKKGHKRARAVEQAKRLVQRFLGTPDKF